MRPDQDVSVQLDNLLKKTNAQLIKRNKELHCLYSISKISDHRNCSLTEILQQIVDILPPAWQYPEDTCARILLKNKEFKTDKFVKTKWRQACELRIKGHLEGSVEIYRMEPIIKENDAIFLKEEKNLLSSVSERLGKMIERRRSEAALQKSEQRFKNLVENSIAGISIVQNNHIIYQNKEQEKLLGPLPRKYVLGDFESIHPDDVETVMSASRDIQMGKIPEHDLDFRVLPAIGNGDNPTFKRVFCRLMFIDYHEKKSILVNTIDMTRIMSLEQLLFRQDKMASLGRVAAGIAHEIRNPLSGINIYLNAMEKLVDRPDSRSKVDQIIDQLHSASRKIESVIRKVMDFAKPGKPKFALTQINEPIEDALTLTAVTFRKSSIEIGKDLDENLPACYADPHLIEEAVLNLLNNAAEAMANMTANKKIAVRSGVTDGHIFIKVSDSGPGVPINIRENVIDPFFTTKNDGTGIGLSLCHRIVTDHNGVLSIGDGILGGAEFRIEIPIRRGGISDD